MTRHRQQSFIKVSPSGVASGVFPGGVEIQSRPDQAFDFDPQNAVAWTRAAGGYAAKIGAYERASGTALVMSANDGDFPNETRLTLFDDSLITDTKVAQIQAGTRSRTLLTSTGKSNFIRQRGDLTAPVKFEMEWDGLNINFYFNDVLVKTL